MIYTTLWGKREEKVGKLDMEELDRELRGLREENPDVMAVLDVYRGLRRDYRDVQEARRIAYGKTPASGSSADVVIAVDKPTSLANY